MDKIERQLETCISKILAQIEEPIEKGRMPSKRKISVLTKLIDNYAEILRVKDY